MNKTRTKKESTPSVKAAAEAPGELLRSWLLLALVALCVARPLLPSEGAAWLGDGQPFVMVWLVVAGGYFLFAAVQGGLARRWDLIDGGVAALVFICALSAVVGAENRADAIELGLVGTGSPRPVLNMLFEWLALGLVFLLARQLIVTPREARAVVAIMIALAVVISSYGYFQVFVGFPAARAQYAKDPDSALQEADQWYPPGSPERLRFEKRLESPEPLGTFALTNSLAGFLAPWLVLSLGVVWNLVQSGAWRGATKGAGLPTRDRASMVRAAVIAAGVLAMAGCFVLTKSRTGYVAVAIGVVLLPFCMGARWKLVDRRVLLAAAVGLAVIVAAAVAIGGLDAALVTEAGKSFGYRWQYWRSTLAMIGRYPWLGVGPGNFQDYYTQFKLPEASEEVRDPHNFLLEVWATAGTFALIALVEVLAAFAWRMWQGPSPAESSVAGGSRTAAASEDNRHVQFMLAGAALGLGLAYLVGLMVGLDFSEQRLFAGLAIGAVVLAALWPWIVRGTLAPRLPALGVLVLAIHLLASGGITFPGVADSFWLLMALGVNLCQVESTAAPRPSTWQARLVPLGAFAISCGAAWACYTYAYGPETRSREAMVRGSQTNHDLALRRKAYLDAAKADPLSAEPWMALAELEFSRLGADPRPGPSFQTFATATEKITQLRPHSSAAWRQVGRWYMELYDKTHDPEAATTAVDCLRNAVELYPNFPTLRGEYALALQAAHDGQLAARNAQRALELDKITPHVDKKLSDDLRQQLEVLAAPSR